MRYEGHCIICDLSAAESPILDLGAKMFISRASKIVDLGLGPMQCSSIPHDEHLREGSDSGHHGQLSLYYLPYLA